jgi:hypothetical protein
VKKSNFYLTYLSVRYYCTSITIAVIIIIILIYISALFGNQIIIIHESLIIALLCNIFVAYIIPKDIFPIYPISLIVVILIIMKGLESGINFFVGSIIGLVAGLISNWLALWIDK